MRSFSLIGARGQVVVQSVLNAVNEALSNDFLKKKLPDMDTASLKKPIKSKDFVIVQDKMAEGSANDGRRADLPTIPAYPHRPVYDRYVLLTDGHLGHCHGEAGQDPGDAPHRAHQADLDHHGQDARGRAHRPDLGRRLHVRFQGHVRRDRRGSRQGRRPGRRRRGADAEAWPDLQHDPATSSSAYPSSWPFSSPWPWP